ncbi:hypothetical protein NPIL_103691 [Nephila pilipes]|uniref:Uncharacterized protein n=1 Tax=Nephila pilipes TaxID=299642 RepID=A0A8X6Q185_NEPPI|nr:hypothetical protein NPIL_103691 [Nephila pilipes]
MKDIQETFYLLHGAQMDPGRNSSVYKIYGNSNGCRKSYQFDRKFPPTPDTQKNYNRTRRVQNWPKTKSGNVKVSWTYYFLDHSNYSFHPTTNKKRSLEPNAEQNNSIVSPKKTVKQSKLKKNFPQPPKQIKTNPSVKPSVSYAQVTSGDHRNQRPPLDQEETEEETRCEPRINKTPISNIGIQPILKIAVSQSLTSFTQS